MKLRISMALLAGVAALGIAGSAFATGLATCDSGDESTWKSQDELKAQLEGEGYKVRRIKVDGGCYEAYVINNTGEMTERYYNPVNLEFIPTDD
jgi:hypothetical protein